MSTSSNNSQRNSAIVKVALKELDERTHEGGNIGNSMASMDV